jgi:hypothetical protein
MPAACPVARHPAAVRLGDERGVWTTPGGDQVLWFRDPDGNVLSLTRFA